MQMYSSQVDDNVEAKHVLDLSVGTITIKWIKSKMTFEIHSTIPCDTIKLFRADTIEEWRKWKKCLTKYLKENRKAKKKATVAPPMPPGGQNVSVEKVRENAPSSKDQRMRSPLYYSSSDGFLKEEDGGVENIKEKNIPLSNEQRSHSPLYATTAPASMTYENSTSHYDEEEQGVYYQQHQDQQYPQVEEEVERENYPWQKCEDENGYIYWYNVDTGKSVWDGDWK